ncbi:MAG: hypothetical protein ACI4RT_02510 [Candidatus Spyradenecus sp.]
MIFAGCGKDDAPPAADPYAQLDARFPEGYPGAASTQERAQDKEYLAKIDAAAKEMIALQRAAEEAKQACENFRTQIVKAMTEKLGKAPSEAMIADQLSKKAYYQELLAAQQATAEAVEAKRKANQAMVRQRMLANIEAYKAMKAEADAAAQAAGLPVRGAVQPAAPAQRPAASAAAEPPAKPLEVPTVETLSKTTGVPVQPSKSQE